MTVPGRIVSRDCMTGRALYKRPPIRSIRPIVPHHESTPMFSTPAYAQTAAPGAGGASALLQIVPLVLIFVIFYFLLIRPQQKRKTGRASCRESVCQYVSISVVDVSLKK